MMHWLAEAGAAAIEAAAVSIGGPGDTMPDDTLTCPVQSPAPGSIGARPIAVPIEVRLTVRQRSVLLRWEPTATTTTTTTTAAVIATPTEMWFARISIDGQGGVSGIDFSTVNPA